MFQFQCAKLWLIKVLFKDPFHNSSTSDTNCWARENQIMYYKSKHRQIGQLVTNGKWPQNAIL